MSLLELFIEHGDPSKSYSDAVLADFLSEIDDGSLFMEAMAEMPESSRKAIGGLVNDQTSRTLSYQAIGRMVIDQLRKYVSPYLQKMYVTYENQVVAAKKRQLDDEDAERKFEASRDPGSGQGWIA